MALATQCPHCKTTFRVAQDQLKLRAGLVRCGSCKEIFNGIEHLLRPDSVAHVAPSATPANNIKVAESHAVPAAAVEKHVEPAKPAVAHHVEAETSEDLASEGIPISLLAKQPASKIEPTGAGGTWLDFVYPDPLPESESKPEPHPELAPQHHHQEERVEPRFESHAESHVESHTEPHNETPVEPERRHEIPTHAESEPATPANSADDEAVQELEAHAAEAVEFVDFVDVPRKHKDLPPVILDVEENKPIDPLQRMTLVDLSDEDEPVEPYIEDVEDISGKAHAEAFAHTTPLAETEPEAEPAQALPEEPDPLDQVIDELKRKPLRKKKPKPYKRLPTQDAAPEVAPDPVADSVSDTESGIDPEENDEPEFVKQSRRAQTVGRTVRIAMGIGSFVLLLGAAGQAIYTFRDQIAVRLPETKPLLTSACTLLNCKIGLPMQIETISIESDQLETLNTNKDLSELTMLLRNNGSIVQTWPNLEVTLNDANNTALSRRVFTPHEYLPASVDSKKGFASNSEQPVKMRFDFTGMKPAGYHVGVFYP